MLLFVYGAWLRMLAARYLVARRAVHTKAALRGWRRNARERTARDYAPAGRRRTAPV